VHTWASWNPRLAVSFCQFWSKCSWNITSVQSLKVKMTWCESSEGPPYSPRLFLIFHHFAISNLEFLLPGCCVLVEGYPECSSDFKDNHSSSKQYRGNLHMAFVLRFYCYKFFA
jgi:hypothetical protein